MGFLPLAGDTALFITAEFGIYHSRTLALNGQRAGVGGRSGRNLPWQGGQG